MKKRIVLISVLLVLILPIFAQNNNQTKLKVGTRFNFLIVNGEQIYDPSLYYGSYGEIVEIIPVSDKLFKMVFADVSKEYFLKYYTIYLSPQDKIRLKWVYPKEYYDGLIDSCRPNILLVNNLEEK